MGGMFGSPPIPNPPPDAPKMTDKEISQAASDQDQLAAQRKGRASTVLTDLQSQRPKRKMRATDV